MTSAAHLTGAEVLAHFQYKDRHSLPHLMARGLVERINTGGTGKGARWRYRLLDREPEPTAFDLKLAQLKKEHRL